MAEKNKIKSASVLTAEKKSGLMDKGAADSYVYAKMSGMLAKSFVGNRAAKLFTTQNLSQLWTTVFEKESPSVPQVMLSQALEREAEKQFLNDYKSLLANYSKPSELLTSLLHFYEYDNLKELSAFLCKSQNSEKMPEITDVSPYQILNYSKWPDLASITAGTSLEWYNHVPEISEQTELDYRLDQQYVREIWNALKKVNGSCRKELEALIGEKIKMDNVVWALRLKVYYKIPEFEILNHLIYSTDEAKESHNKDDIFVKEAVKILDWEIDDWEKWRKWHYSSLLNPHEDGVIWNADPRWISNAYKSKYVMKAYKMFHLYPFTECPLVCFFIVKRNELDNIRTAAESLRLNVSYTQAMKIAGIQEV